MTEYRITAGPYTAAITARGAALRELRHGERDLIVPFHGSAAHSGIRVFFRPL